MAPVRLHLTIGLMSLVNDKKLAPSTAEQGDVQGQRISTKTIKEALERFATLRNVIDDVVRHRKEEKLDVSFNRLSSFQTKLENCQVCFNETSNNACGLLRRF